MTEGYDNTVTATHDRPAASPAPAGRRRRGAALEAAIRRAAFDELAEVGYLAFSVENVAARAGTGKASIYRRFPSKQELIMDAVTTELPMPPEATVLDDSVTTVDALLAIGQSIGETMNSPAGDAIKAIKFESLADPGLAALVDERFQAPRRAGLLALLRRGVERGEVRPDAATQIVADVLPAVLIHRVVMLDQPVRPADVRAVIEQVVIPLVESR
jgi:AcrR family transcriptional regulator